jgi:exopolyphosphatase/guanosine-5'-triphosphate,3'-diphosphate pyrophosphatase
MRVGVVDIGSNTARLLVAELTGQRTERVAEAKAYLGLGAEILTNEAIGPDKIAQTAAEAHRFLVVARELGAAVTDVFVTAPGRQARNGDELVAAISRATGHVVRVLSAREEGELAYQGALANTSVGAEPVAVCDVGGGSTEITVGDSSRGPFWGHSVEIGSLRLTAATLTSDPPKPGQLRAARQTAAELFGGVEPPRVRTALAVGGSARGLAKLAGRRLDAKALERALAQVVSQPTDVLARSMAFDTARAATLAGGAVILLELTRLLGEPLQLAGGGLREGAAARLLASRAAA